MKNELPTDKMKKSIRNVFWLYAMLFFVVIFYIFYFLFFTSGRIVNDPHNPRLGVLDNEIKRGAIYDNRGYMIANSDLHNGQYIRKYYFDNNLCHILGYVGRGKSGVEARHNFDLQKLHNEAWQRISQLITGTELRGNSLTLTINMEIQKSAYEQLGKKRGAVVVMEPDTGKILAMASYPNFNPNTISENWDALDTSEDSPFLNRASQGLYTPGSVFKLVTSTALIEDNEAFEEIVFDCEGEEDFNNKVIHCFDGKKHGEVDIYEAFARSCNTFFSQMGYEMGAQRLLEAAEARYFNKPLNYPLEYNRSVFQLSADSTDSELVETAIGQGRTLVSPLHVAMVTSAVANGGIMMQPYVIDNITAYNGKIVSKNLPVMLNSLFTPDEAAIMDKMMRQVVEYGTGSGAAIANAYVAGKTGTAENPNGTSHSWFTSYAVKDAKKVAVTVVLENPEEGQSAVPIAKNILIAALENM